MPQNDKKRQESSHVSFGTTAEVKRFLADLKANDCEVEFVDSAGTALARDGDQRVFVAIQKGSGGPWIIRFIDSDRITWSKP